MNTKVYVIVQICFLMILGVVIPSKAQLISDYCKNKDSFGAVGDRVYYRVEKEILKDNSWEIIGNYGVVGKIRKDEFGLGERWVIENNLGMEIGYIDDKSFIRDLQKSSLIRISIEKDGLGRYVVREYGIKIGEIDKPYNDILSTFDSDCSSNRSLLPKLWDPLEKIRKETEIPNPYEQLREEIRKLTTIPNPMEELEEDEPFNNTRKPSYNSLSNYPTVSPMGQKNNLIPDPVEEVRKNMNPWNSYRKSYTSPSYINPSKNLYKIQPIKPIEPIRPIEPIKPFRAPSFGNFNSFDHLDDDWGISPFNSNSNSLWEDW